MALDSHKFSLSAGLTAGVAYLVCTAFCYLWPQLSSDLMAPMVHMSSVGTVVTLQGTVLGLVQFVAYTYALVYLWAWLYNGLLARR